ncbi:YfaZ family outer membrane protein [Methylobacter sp.]|uniref:YfaZ family outer membrane protein n=1 Tax=Methylobacter sp. TaxID=2051955 RepID=UPI00120E178A|nr:YfaZ family outer membrane protein [Methylobacter sp.]TAK64465.1 MAG: hypothetical protein EPO18_03335 [Methylobacter sp.]
MKKGFLVPLALCASLTCQAGDYIFEPVFSVDERYEDNLLLQINPSHVNWISTVSPAVRLGYLLESGDLVANFKWNQLIYHNESTLNVAEKLFNADYLYNGELFSFNLNGDYSIQSSLTTELGSTGSGQLSNVQLLRTNRIIAPTFSYRLTERDTLQLGYSYNDVTYEKSSTNSGLSDYISQQLSTSASHKLSERQQVSLSGSYSLFKAPSADQNSTTISYQAGWQYSFSEKTQLGLSIGMRNTDTESLGGRIKSSTSGHIFSANLDRATEWGSISVNAGQQLNPASTGQQQQATTFSARTIYNINERWYTSLSVNYLKSDATSGANSNNRTYATLSPALNWRWTPETKLELSYSYRQQQFDNENDARVGNSVQLQFIYQPQINHR